MLIKYLLEYTYTLLWRVLVEVQYISCGRRGGLDVLLGMVAVAAQEEASVLLSSAAFSCQVPPPQ